MRGGCGNRDGAVELYVDCNSSLVEVSYKCIELQFIARLVNTEYIHYQPYRLITADVSSERRMFHSHPLHPLL